jgi:hypothetical protein
VLLLLLLYLGLYIFRKNTRVFATMVSSTTRSTPTPQPKTHFSTSTPRTKELAKMSEEEVSGLKVKEDRLMGDLHETCEWGKGEVWGR